MRSGSWFRSNRAAPALVMTVGVVLLLGYATSACCGTKISIFGKPEWATAQPNPTDATAVTFADLWTLDPSQYEVLGHIWVRGKSDFSKSGPAEQAAREAIGAQAALLGADMALGFHTANLAVFEGKLWFPGGGIGIDTRWSSALAVKRIVTASATVRPRPPICVALLPLLATDDVIAKASDDDLFSIATYSFAASWCLLGQRGYHVSMLPDSLFSAADVFVSDPASLQVMVKSICPWSDFVMLFALGNPSGATSKDTMKKADTISALYDVRDGHWQNSRGDPADREIQLALQGLGGELKFVPTRPAGQLEGNWNKSVVGVVKDNVKILPELVAQ